MNTIQIPAYAGHIELLADSENKIPRLLEVLAHIHGINSHVLSKVMELADHKGDLTVYWSDLPTQQEFEVLKAAWENPPGDCSGWVKQEFAGHEITLESFAVKDKFEFEQVGEEVLMRVEVTPGKGFEIPRLTKLTLKFKTPISLNFSAGKCNLDAPISGTFVHTKEICLNIFDKETPISIYRLLPEVLKAQGLTAHHRKQDSQEIWQYNEATKLQLTGNRYQIGSISLAGDPLMGLSWIDQAGSTKHRDIRSLTIRPSDMVATHELPWILGCLLDKIDAKFIDLCIASARAA